VAGRLIPFLMTPQQPKENNMSQSSPSRMVEGKVVVVTGAGGGIGRDIALAMAREGARLVVNDIGASVAGEGNDAGPAQKVVDEIRALGGEAVASTDSVSEALSAGRIVQTALDTFGRIDVVVNNAGILSSAPYDKVTESEWDQVMDVNLRGHFFASSEALKPMLAQGWGRIIFISSLSGRNGGFSAGPAYVAAKAAVIGITRHLARKVARNGITVNAVAPGTTETDILKMYSDEEIAAQINAILVGRLGKPEEIADTVAFLASDSAAFITGAVIDINGGMYMG